MKKTGIIITTIFVVLIITLLVFMILKGNYNKNNEKEVIEKGNMEIKSVFNNNEKIPSKYTCDGEDVNPLLEISEIPDSTKSLVLIMDDPDATVGTWDHWVVYNISPETTKIDENSIPGTEGTNSFKRLNYGGPCPPSGTHRYFFKLYALDKELDLEEGATKKEVEDAMKNHILGEAELIGLYERS